MNFDPDQKSHEEMREFFKVSDTKDMVTDMHEKMLKKVTERIEARSLRFYAFLNKEFNVMNYKNARCSKHCFDNVNKPLADVNLCLNICKQGIRDCSTFANNLQKESQDELMKCKAEAEKHQNLSDPFTHWMACHEKLLLRYDQIEEQISEEFSNFV